MNIVALGNAAIKIAKHFAKYPQYTCYHIDIDIEDNKHSKCLTKYSSAEEYEEKTPSFNEFFKDIEGDEVLFICVGSSAISSVSLKVLEAVKDKKITVLYVRPDLTLLSDKAIIQEKLTFNVFQHYARSGMFERIYLVDNVRLEQILGDIPIIQYYDRLNETISSTFHMINVYKHVKPILDTKIELPEVSRIATFGILEKNGEEKFFFPIQFITNQVYYYAFSKDSLEKDGKIFQNIKKQIKVKTEHNTKVSFGIFATEYKENYAYCEAYTHFVQEEIK